MRSLLLRFWGWLGRLLGVETTNERPAMPVEQGQELRPAEPAAPNLPPTPPAVPLPPPLPPQMDLHAGEQAQFGRKASILTRNEEKLYTSLLRAVVDDYQIMAKVRLWDFIWLVNEPPERKQHLSRLSCRHVDFLLCRPLTLKPLLVIELDDKSHQNAYAQENDRYKDELFAAAGIPILRLSHPNFPPRQLREQIEKVLDDGDEP